MEEWSKAKEVGSCNHCETIPSRIMASPVSCNGTTTALERAHLFSFPGQNRNPQISLHPAIISCHDRPIYVQQVALPPTAAEQMVNTRATIIKHV